MNIKFLGHACFRLTDSKGTSIITDPYEPGAFGGGIGYSAIDEEADVVLVSHEHADHNFVRGVPGTPTICRGACNVNGYEFKTVTAFHDQSGGAKRGTVHVFIFELDGMRICHVGDLGAVLSDEQIDQIRPVDVLLVPVGGTFTLDACMAWELVEKLQPRVAIPMHYRTAKIRLPIATLDAFTNGKDNVMRPLSSTIDLSRDNLPEKTQVLVLEPAN